MGSGEEGVSNNSSQCGSVLDTTTTMIETDWLIFNPIGTSLQQKVIVFTLTMESIVVAWTGAVVGEWTIFTGSTILTPAKRSFLDYLLWHDKNDKTCNFEVQKM